MDEKNKIYDCIIIGSGMGGMTAASYLSNAGHSTLVLEAAFSLGGCSSSYKRKGFVFESGATTLIGFDKHQPLRILEDDLGINIPKIPIEPSMQVHMNGKKITRFNDREEWIEEAISHFGEPEAQRSFWELAFKVADIVWKVSGKNHFFPPQKPTDWLRLLKNDPRDVWVLPYALQSVKDVAGKKDITNPDFIRFLDEQLMISAQAPSSETPFLLGAPACTYTNATNYSVPGGLIQMVHSLRDFIEKNNGVVKNKEKVISLEQSDGGYRVLTEKAGKRREYRGKLIVSNLPVWNMKDVTHGKLGAYFEKESSKYQKAWGAFTMGIAMNDVFDDDMPLHHQIHLTEEDKREGLNSDSIFVSLSHPDDKVRSRDGYRTLNISTHANPEFWFNLNGNYEQLKQQVQEQIINILVQKFEGFHRDDIDTVFSSTPVTWNNWVYRKKGRVGGIPQQMDRSLLDWTPAETPFEGLYLVGDTVFPGQGIPGVTLSGINVYYRIQNFLNQ
jgi:C-3',4' desaturase CrtD